MAPKKNQNPASPVRHHPAPIISLGKILGYRLVAGTCSFVRTMDQFKENVCKKLIPETDSDHKLCAGIYFNKAPSSSTCDRSNGGSSGGGSSVSSTSLPSTSGWSASSATSPTPSNASSRKRGHQQSSSNGGTTSSKLPSRQPSRMTTRSSGIKTKAKSGASVSSSSTSCNTTANTNQTSRRGRPVTREKNKSQTSINIRRTVSNTGLDRGADSDSDSSDDSSSPGRYKLARRSMSTTSQSEAMVSCIAGTNRSHSSHRLRSSSSHVHWADEMLDLSALTPRITTRSMSQNAKPKKKNETDSGSSISIKETKNAKKSPPKIQTLSRKPSLTCSKTDKPGLKSIQVSGSSDKGRKPISETKSQKQDAVKIASKKIARNQCIKHKTLAKIIKNIPLKRLTRKTRKAENLIVEIVKQSLQKVSKTQKSQSGLSRTQSKSKQTKKEGSNKCNVKTTPKTAKTQKTVLNSLPNYDCSSKADEQNKRSNESSEENATQFFNPAGQNIQLQEVFLPGLADVMDAPYFHGNPLYVMEDMPDVMIQPMGAMCPTTTNDMSQIGASSQTMGFAMRLSASPSSTSQRSIDHVTKESSQSSKTSVVCSRQSKSKASTSSSSCSSNTSKKSKTNDKSKENGGAGASTVTLDSKSRKDRRRGASSERVCDVEKMEAQRCESKKSVRVRGRWTKSRLSEEMSQNVNGKKERSVRKDAKGSISVDACSEGSSSSICQLDEVAPQYIWMAQRCDQDTLAIVRALSALNERGNFSPHSNHNLIESIESQNHSRSTSARK